MSKNFESIRNQLSDFFRSASFDEKKEVFNEWRDTCCDEEYILHDTDEDFDDVLGGCRPTDLYAMGYDGSCMDEYFQYDGYDEVTFFNRTEATEIISESIGDIIDYIIENEDPLYNDDIDAILNGDDDDDDDDDDASAAESDKPDDIDYMTDAEFDAIEKTEEPDETTQLSESKEEDLSVMLDWDNIAEYTVLDETENGVRERFKKYMTDAFLDYCDSAQEEAPFCMSDWASGAGKTVLKMAMKLAKLETVLLE